MYNFIYVFMLFLIYSIIGWVVDIIGYFLDKHSFKNRGFLIGPYCPIYGVSSIFMIYCLGQYKNDPVVLFVMSVLICSIMEYLTSYIMEKLFHARWWDYTHLPFNINGRVCLRNSMMFGVLSLLLIKFINPFFDILLSTISHSILIIIGLLFLCIFILDICVSFNIINKLKITTDNIRKDNTEEITKEVRDVLTKKSALSRRLIGAFPNFEAIGKKVTKLFDK